MKKKREHLLNREIRASEVRVADVGVMSIDEAIKLAESQDLDLVLINNNTIPPVTKILNYEKFIYSLNKENKQKTKAPEEKEIKIGPNTAENDLGYRIKHIIEFLSKGHRIRLSMQFRGREMMYLKSGEELMHKIISSVQEHGVVDASPKLEGKKMFALIRPISKK